MPHTRTVLVAFLSLGIAGAALAQNASYRVTFSTAWSASSHPGAYPATAHFSPLVGGVHDGTVSFWQPGGIASPGVKAMAELGATAPLVSEVQAAIAAGSARASIVGTGGGISAPGMSIVNITATERHPLLTLTTMIAPSPDWFVGVHGYPLRDETGRWVTDVTLTLLPYDAGTDSGLTFTAGNLVTNPFVPIFQITGAPFAGLPTMATYRIQLTRHPADFNGIGGTSTQDLFDFITAWQGQLTTANYNGINGVTVQDLFDYISSWQSAF
jgi:hypothetical protein